LLETCKPLTLVVVQVPASLERVVIEVEGWLELDCPAKALEKITTLLDHPAGRAVGLVLQVRAMVAMNEFQKALDTLGKLEGSDHDQEWADLTEAWCRKRMNDLAGAARCMERLIDRGKCAIGHFNLACYLALMGKQQRALDELAIACGMDPRFRKLLNEEEDLVSLRDDPAFKALLLKKRSS
jgi:thioredoxin-like negative regulator of GroEL